jgi:hypothetical protein
MGTYTMCMFSPVTILTEQLEIVFRETIPTEPSVELKNFNRMEMIKYAIPFNCGCRKI